MATKDNKENIREFYERNELLKERQRISSHERFRKAYLEAEPKKKDSGTREELTPPSQSPAPPHTLSNNWTKPESKPLRNSKLP